MKELVKRLDQVNRYRMTDEDRNTLDTVTEILKLIDSMCYTASIFQTHQPKGNTDD